MDLIVMLLMALGMLSTLPAYRAVMWLGVGLIGGCVLMLLLMPWSRVQAWLEAHPHAAKAHIKALAGAAAMLLSARRFLSPGMLIGGLALGLLSWGAEAVGFKLVGDVIHPEAPLSWAAAMGIYATAILVGALSFLPGGLGSTEAVMTSLLYAQGYALPQALLLTMLCRILTLWLAVVIGWLCVWILRDDNPDRR
jgi:glycosyltransferase 2 family protein